MLRIGLVLFFSKRFATVILKIIYWLKFFSAMFSSFCTTVKIYYIMLICFRIFSFIQIENALKVKKNLYLKTSNLLVEVIFGCLDFKKGKKNNSNLVFSCIWLSIPSFML